MTQQTHSLGAKQSMFGWSLKEFSRVFPGGSEVPIASRKKTVSIPCNKLFENFEKIAGLSTAGFIWGNCRFPHIWDNRLLVIHPWWNQTAIISLRDQEVISNRMELGSELADIYEFEKAEVVEKLKSFVQDLKNDKHKRIKNYLYTTGLTIGAAIHFSGKWKLEPAIEYLFEIEKLPSDAECASGNFSLIGGIVVDFFYLVRLAKLALRRIGQTPLGYPSLIIEEPAVRVSDQPYSGVKRHENMSKLRSGSNLQNIVNLFGQPDYIHGCNLRYDIDVESPYTIMIEFDEVSTQIKSLTSYTPALWMDGVLIAQTDIDTYEPGDIYRFRSKDFLGEETKIL